MIKNMTRNKVLANRAVLAKSKTSQTIGFMFQNKSDKGIVFIFNMEKNMSFHTFFMRFNLDFLFLDAQKRVKSIVFGVKPWHLFVFGHGKYVVEVPAGKAKGTKIGDRISFK